MAEREIIISLGAKDNGASQVVNRLNQAIRDIQAKGGDTAIVFSTEFKDALTSQIVADEVSRMQREADKHQIEVEAKLIARDARTQLYGADPAKGPLRPTNRSGDDQAFRNARADALQERRQMQNEARLGVGGGDQRYVASDAWQNESGEAGHAAGKKAKEGFIGSLKELTGNKGVIKEAFELATGAGALAGVTFVANEIGEMADHAKELVHQFNLGEIGSGQLEAETVRQVLVLGPMVKMWDSIGGFIWEAVDATGAHNREIEEQKKQNAEIGRQLKEQRDAKRQIIIDEVNRAAQAEKEAGELRGRTGDDLTIQRATQEFNKKMAEADALAAKKGSLNGEQQADVEKKIQTLRSGAYADFYAVQGQIQKDANEKGEASVAQTEAKVAQITAATQAQRLKARGEGFAAELAQLKASHDQQISELDTQRKTDQKQLGGDTADSNFQKGKQAADEKYAADVASAEQLHQREKLDQQRNFEKQFLDTQSTTAQARLRAAGQDYQAERLANKQALDDRLSDVRDNLIQQLREHAERAPELRQQAKDQAAAAIDQFNAVSDASARQAFKPSSSVIQGQEAGLLTGVADTALSQDRANQLAAARDTARNTAAISDKVTSIAQQLAQYLTGQTPILQ